MTATDRTLTLRTWSKGGRRRRRGRVVESTLLEGSEATNKTTATRRRTGEQGGGERGKREEETDGARAGANSRGVQVACVVSATTFYGESKYALGWSSFLKLKSRR